MQINMLDAKSQLSRLVKAALAGEEVIIASHGKAQVKLVPCAPDASAARYPGHALVADRRCPPGPRHTTTDCAQAVCGFCGQHLGGGHQDSQGLMGPIVAEALKIGSCMATHLQSHFACSFERWPC